MSLLTISLFGFGLGQELKQECLGRNWSADHRKRLIGLFFLAHSFVQLRTTCPKRRPYRVTYRPIEQGKSSAEVFYSRMTLANDNSMEKLLCILLKRIISLSSTMNVKPNTFHSLTMPRTQTLSGALWHMCIISVLERLRQEKGKFKDSLSCTARFSQKQNKQS